MRSAYDVGHDLLGPLIYRFCYQLWLHQLGWAKRDAVALFLSRGGIRLGHFYRLFLDGNGIGAPLPMRDYYVSRMSSYVTNIARDPEFAAGEIAKEFMYWNIHDAMGALLPWKAFEPWWNSLGEDLQAVYRQEIMDGGKFLSLMADGNPGQGVLRSHFAEQAALSRRHLDELREGRNNVLLVDTGWSGSILNSIQKAFPDMSFMGHFFGRYAYKEEWKPWFWQLVGIEVEDTGFRWGRPHTSLLRHRHLIEGMCEPDWPSVEGYMPGDDGCVRSLAGPIPPERIVPSPAEGFAAGVADYVRACRHGTGAYAIHRAAAGASRRLRWLICFPGARQVRHMTVTSRSADFGKNIDVPVLLEPRAVKSFREKLTNVERSLWPEAQIALEFGAIRFPIQLLYVFAEERLADLARRADRWVGRLARAEGK